MARPIVNLRDQGSAMREVGGGLIGQLTPQENFGGFEWTGSIHAGVEQAIRNKLRDGQFPNRYIIFSQEPVPTISKGPTAWNQNYVYLRNVATISTVTATVYFYKHRGALE